jgi:hypothetical protein
VKNKLYHGTSSIFVFNLLRPGSYSTDDYEVALSYAEEKVSVVGGTPVVYEVEMDVAKVIQKSPILIYQADSWMIDEMGFKVWVNNAPITLGRIIEENNC